MNTMPPKRKAQTASQKDQCCDESLFCAGDCQQLLHCYCAGVSAQCYRSITEKASPFFCFACCLVRHKGEIDSLKETVELLKGEIAVLKSSQSQSPQHKSAARGRLLFFSTTECSYRYVCQHLYSNYSCGIPTGQT